MKAREKAYFASAGAALAALQFCLFFMLEARLSSSWTTYAAVTVSWFLGSALVLLLPRAPATQRLAAAAGAAYYACLVALTLRPFSDPALALGAAAALLAGAYSGGFFRAAYAASGAVAPLFAGENDGFVAGLAACFAGFAVNANALLWAGPAAALALQAWAGRKAALSRASRSSPAGCP